MTLDIDQAESIFLNLLAKAGVVLSTEDKNGLLITDNPSPKLIWSAFKEFAKIGFKVEDSESDALLFQWGNCEDFEMNIPRFYLDFTRQFCLFHADSNYDHMEQLHCTLKYEINNDFNMPVGNFWSYKFDNSFESFFKAVEKTEQFYLGMNKYQPLRLEMCHGQV